VGYALSMSAEIREWLAALAVRDPDAAIAAGQPLVALADAGLDPAVRACRASCQVELP